jgi:hypothetical protein
VSSALDRASTYIVAAAIVAAAAGSSVQFQIWQVGRPLRWALLASFVAFALVRAAVGLRRWRLRPLVVFALAAFCGVALVSTAWSVNRHGTLGRALGVTAVVAAAAALAGCVRERPELAARLLEGVLLAALVVVVSGFVYWLVSPSHATLAATTEYPSRYQGLEQSPNTPPLLLSFALAIALVRALTAAGRLRRALFALTVLAVAASIVASGARGGLLGAFAGVVAVAVLLPRAHGRRLAAVGASVVAFAAAAWITTLPSSLPAQPTPPPARGAVADRNADAVLPLAQEIGNPWWTRRSGGSARSLFNTSIRLRALGGTFDQIGARPLLGYGFGAEQWAFVNRYYAFDSQNPENGYVGMLLQVGAIGFAAFLAAVALCLVPGARAAWRTREPVAVASVAAVVAGLVLAVSQSFFHGPGSIAFLAFWLSLLLAAAIPLRRAS